MTADEKTGTGGIRRLIKRGVHVVAVVLAAPFIALALIERLLSKKSEVAFAFCGQLLAPAPGLPGAFLRAAYYWATTQKTSWEIHVGFGSVLVHRAVTLRAHASMGAYCVIGHADIGEQVMLGSRVSIPSGKRQHLDDNGALTGESAHFDTVRIGRATWVGEGAIIMADVGAGSIVSAGSVVVHAAPDRVIVAGNPARVVRELPTSPER